MNDPKMMNTAAAQAADIDAGLRAYMLGVYNYMTTALAVTGLFAYGVKMLAVGVTPAGQKYLTGLGQLLYNTPLQWVVMLAPLGMVFYLSAKVASLKLRTAQTLFYVFAALMGISLSSILLVYTGDSVARVFFITAGAFAGLSLYGYTTKRDLGPIGAFMVMGVIGLLLAMIVNMFMQNQGLELMISVIGVLLFAGLTAYDTQRIKSMYMISDSHNIAQKKSITGALTLYLDFINMFLFLLRLLGNRE